MVKITQTNQGEELAAISLLRTRLWHCVLMFRNLQISQKLNVGFGILVAFTFVVVCRSYLSSAIATRNIRNVNDIYAPSSLSSTNAQATLLRMMSDVRAYLATGESKYRDRYQTARRDFETELTVLSQLVQQAHDPDNKIQMLLTTLQQNYQEWLLLPNQLFRLRDNESANQPALKLLYEEGEVKISIILAETEAMMAEQELRSPTTDNIILLKEIADFRNSFTLMSSAIRGYLTTQNDRFRIEYSEPRNRNQSSWDALVDRKAMLTPDQQASMATIAIQRAKLLELLPKMFDLVKSDRYREDLYIFETQAEPLSDEMIELLDAIVQEEQTYLTTTLQSSVTSLETTRWLLSLSAILALLAGILMAIVLQRQIAAPIRRLTEVTSRIIGGDWTARAVVESTDETGILASTFNQMTQQLLDSQQELAASNDQLKVLLQEQAERAVELEQAKAEAEAANYAKSEFLATMNHEFRTPLNGILGYAQILGRDATVTPQQRKGISIIEQCGNHLLTLINDVLDLAKIEAQKLDLCIQHFHLPNFIMATAEMCRIKAQQKGIRFICKVSEQLPVAVQADDKRLRQVLLNLLSNAIKFTNAGTVTFTVALVQPGISPPIGNSLDLEVAQNPEANGSEANEAASCLQPDDHPCLIRFQVDDTGVGIASDRLEQIFLPFEQAGDHHQRAEGTGLGLAITQKLITMMGSTIHVRSTVGTGSTFWFDLEILPSLEIWKEVTGASQLEQVIAYEGDRRRILVVDDRDENRSVLLSMLKPLGFEVIEALNGHQALDLALQQRPDLIITDLLMAEMDGIELTKQLRQRPDFNTIPILASSASVSLVDPQAAIHAGCNSFFSKPVDYDTLLNELQTHLNLRWIRADHSTSPTAIDPYSSALIPAASVSLIAPPAAELTLLHQAALGGVITHIQREANRFRQLDDQYIPFADHIMALAQDFDIETILRLVEQYL